jgi:hypothetical protein
MPEFLYAFDADTFAVGHDPTGMSDFNFDAVATAQVSYGASDAFVTAPVDVTVEFSGVGGTRTGLFVALRNTVWSGTLAGVQLSSPIHVAGDISVDDVVDVAVALAGLDRQAALEFMAGLFGFDPANPPETVPFAGDLAVE